MSEIIDNGNQQILGGSIQFAVKRVDPGDCEFCHTYIYGGFDFMSKLVCANCREKILTRIQLILKFE
jgi:hypothetical protein